MIYLMYICAFVQMLYIHFKQSRENYAIFKISGKSWKKIFLSIKGITFCYCFSFLNQFSLSFTFLSFFKRKRAMQFRNLLIKKCVHKKTFRFCYFSIYLKSIKFLNSKGYSIKYVLFCLCFCCNLSIYYWKIHACQPKDWAN